MATLSDIKRRIVSIQSTQKITSAMKMVSAAKLRRAQEAIEASRPYAQRMRETLEEVGGGEATHPLFEQREEKARVEIVVITSDRGLAGAYNSQIIQATEALKYFLGIGESLSSRLLLIDALSMSFREVRLKRNPDCPLCGDNPTVTELIDYEIFCGITEPHEPAVIGSD